MEKSLRSIKSALNKSNQKTGINFLEVEKLEAVSDSSIGLTLMAYEEIQ